MGIKNWLLRSGNIISIAILIMGLASIGTGIFIVNKSNKMIASKNAQLNTVNKKLISIQKNNSSNLKKINEEIDALKNTNKILEKEINQQGKKEKALATSRSIEHTYETIHVVATAYTAHCDTGCTGITRTGIDVNNTTHINDKRIVAVDTSIIPLHSILKIHTEKSGTFYAEAEDTGGAIVGHRIDVLMSSNSEAFNFGRQNATIEILRRGA